MGTVEQCLESGQLVVRLEHATTLSAETDSPLDRGCRVAADPDRAVELLDVDAPGTAQRGALGGDVRRGQAVAREPLPDAGVETAGDRVLDDTDVRAERPDLDLTLRAGRVRPRDADVEVAECRPVGTDRQH